MFVAHVGVVHTEQARVAADIEIDFEIGVRDETSLFINDFDDDVRDIMAVSDQLLAIGSDFQAASRSGGFQMPSRDFLPIVVADRFHFSGLVGQPPFDGVIGIVCPVSDATGVAVEEQFHGLAIGRRRDADEIVCFVGPVPVSRDPRNTPGEFASGDGQAFIEHMESHLGFIRPETCKIVGAGLYPSASADRCIAPTVKRPGRFTKVVHDGPQQPTDYVVVLDNRVPRVVVQKLRLAR